MEDLNRSLRNLVELQNMTCVSCWINTSDEAWEHVLLAVGEISNSLQEYAIQ